MEKKKKILIIEDNPQCCEDHINVLKQKYDVSVTFSIYSAVRHLKLYYFDLVIVDIMMPTYGLDYKNEYTAGLDFYYLHIRLNYPSMKVLAWSAASSLFYSYIEGKGGEKEFPNLYFVEKNFFSLEEFKTKVEQILSTKNN